MTPKELIDSAAGVLVDLDGTLVDSSEPVRRVWTAFAHRHGLDPEQVLHVAHGRPSRETVALLAPAAVHAEEAAVIESAEVSDADGVRALPGAAALLGSQRPLAVVTSCSELLARTRLRAASLPVPDVLVSSDSFERGKPDPACFVEGARRLGLDASDCVVIEDAPAGIAAGLAAGATVIAVRTTHVDYELRDAHAIVDDVATLVG